MLTRRKALLLMASALGVSRAGAAAEEGRRFERGLMATRFMVTCYHEDAELVGKAVEAAFAEAERINDTASDYIADSELLSIGKVPPGTPVRIPPLLFGLLEEAWSQAEKTGGLFDPTIGPLSRLWRESRRRKALPDAATLARAKAAVGWRKLVLDPAELTATFTVPDMRLDLGGIAKGQTADRMLAILGAHGVSRSSVTAGGDVRMGDPPPGKEGWNIGVRNTDVDHNAEELLLRNKAVSTSGDLRQFIEIGGVRYSHIIDPATGLGLTKPAAATVIAANATISDALATACCIVDREAGKRLVEAQGAEVFHADG